MVITVRFLKRNIALDSDQTQALDSYQTQALDSYQRQALDSYQRQEHIALDSYQTQEHIPLDSYQKTGIRQLSKTGTHTIRQLSDTGTPTIRTPGTIDDVDTWITCTVDTHNGTGAVGLVPPTTPWALHDVTGGQSSQSVVILENCT